MEPTTFPQQNTVFGAGNNPNTVDLPVAICSHRDTPGIPFILSKWNFTDAEVDFIVKNRSFFHATMGNQIFPFRPVAYDPFESGEFTPLDLPGNLARQN